YYTSDELRPGVTLSPLGGSAYAAGEHRLAVYEDGLTDLLVELREAGSEVALVPTLPKPFGWSLHRCSALAVVWDTDRCLHSTFPADANDAIDAARAAEASAARRAGVDLWDPIEEMCPDAMCPMTRDGELLWRDEGH